MCRFFTCPHCVVLPIELSCPLFCNTMGKQYILYAPSFQVNVEIRQPYNIFHSLKWVIKLFPATFIWKLKIKADSICVNADHFCVLLTEPIAVTGFLFTECLIVNKLDVCKQLFVEFPHTSCPNAALWQCARNHLSISHILSVHPCHGGKLTRFDTTLFSDLKRNRGSAPKCIVGVLQTWSYLPLTSIGSTANWQIIPGYHIASITALCHSHTHTAALIDWSHLLVHVAPDSLGLLWFVSVCVCLWVSTPRCVCVVREAVWQVSPSLSLRHPLL